MFLSRLTIDIGNDPTRERPGRLWLRNLYRVHQRLSMAFPTNPRKERDPGFLAPYAPEDFPEQRHLADKRKTEVDPEVLKQVHSARNSEAGFLFRIDAQPGGRVVIVVQSGTKPDWEYAFHNACYLLAAPPEIREFDPRFSAGKRLRFRLVANPTRRLSKHSLGRDGKPVEKWANVKGKGMRVPVATDRLLEWLTRQAETAGFAVGPDSVSFQPGYVYVNKGRDGQGQRLRRVRYDGVLTVTGPTAFRETIVRGIGSGKAFGFGLLSVAPYHAPIAAEAP